jgi:CelD/BcsL family acetyltransferase involved in cellulose biosynthesis
VLRLTKIPLDVGGRPNPLAWTPGRLTLELQAHGVAVSTPWEACARRIFSRNRREKLKKGWRELSGFGEIRFRAVTDTAEMAGLFDRLAAQRLRRFAALQRNDPLHDPNFLDFYRDIVARGAGSGFARLTLIESDERPVAMLFGVCHGGAFHLLIPTFFDGPWSQLGPGMLLSARTMQWAAEDGLTYYDFTIGNEDYKGRLGATAHDLVEIVAAGSWRGLPTIAAVRLKATIKRHSRLLAVVRKAQGAMGHRSA